MLRIGFFGLGTQVCIQVVGMRYRKGGGRAGEKEFINKNVLKLRVFIYYRPNLTLKIFSNAFNATWGSDSFSPAWLEVEFAIFYL